MNIKSISMIKLIKIFSLLFFLGAVSFLLFQSGKAPKTVEDWAGKYELSIPNFIETRVMLIERKMKGAYVSAVRQTFLLKEDMTFEQATTYAKKESDTTFHYNGTWELLDKEPVLHFESGRMLYLHRSSVSKSVYYMEYVLNCQDTTKGVYFINSFKKIE